MYDVLIYLDFDGIFDRNPAVPVNALRQKKAESLFRPEGINLDFGTGSKNYIAFERSASMSRKARLSFVRADIFNPLLLAITMNLPIKNCELSKLYAYNGLMFSSGKRVETDLFGNADNIVIVDNPSVVVKDVPVVTVRDVTGKGNVRKYERIEKTDDIDVTAFDGEGFVSPEFAEEINTKLYGKQNRHSHTSFQIRLPYIKGMIHQVDFKAFFAEYGITQIIDIWGKAHNVNNIKMILTKSQFKCASWLNEDWNFYRDYCLVCRLFNHALYITNVSKELPENEITLNYQFLCTLSVQPEQFRPADLPLGWDHPPQDDERHWLTKATEQKYYSLCSDEEFRLDYFISKARRRFFGRKNKDDRLSVILRANPLFINESIFTKQLDDMAKKLLEDYAIGRLIVSGENRFLSGDLYEMLRSLSPYYVFDDEEKKAKFQMLPDARNTTIFTPGNVYPMWRSKVIHYQTALCAETTEADFPLLFDTAIADALELGPLRTEAILLAEDEIAKINKLRPCGVPDEVMPEIARFYIANKCPESEWVVLPVANMCAYFHSTEFSKKWLPKLPLEFIERKKSCFGVCMIRVNV